MSFIALAQTPTELSFDKKVHDFGRITTKDIPAECSFTVTNTGKDTVLIRLVSVSCKCTSASWTRTPIAPGDSGVIKAVYKENLEKAKEGIVFNKILHVYSSNAERPVSLHIRGVVGKDE